MLQKRHTNRGEWTLAGLAHWPLLTAYECVDKCRGNLSPRTDRPNCIAVFPCRSRADFLPSIYCTVIDILDHLEGFGTNRAATKTTTTTTTTTCECPTLARKIYFNCWLFDLWAPGMSPRLLFFLFCVPCKKLDARLRDGRLSYELQRDRARSCRNSENVLLAGPWNYFSLNTIPSTRR